LPAILQTVLKHGNLDWHYKKWVFNGYFTLSGQSSGLYAIAIAVLLRKEMFLAQFLNSYI